MDCVSLESSQFASSSKTATLSCTASKTACTESLFEQRFAKAPAACLWVSTVAGFKGLDATSAKNLREPARIIASCVSGVLANSQSAVHAFRRTSEWPEDPSRSTRISTIAGHVFSMRSALPRFASWTTSDSPCTWTSSNSDLLIAYSGWNKSSSLQRSSRSLSKSDSSSTVVFVVTDVDLLNSGRGRLSELLDSSEANLFSQAMSSALKGDGSSAMDETKSPSGLVTMSCSRNDACSLEKSWLKAIEHPSLRTNSTRNLSVPSVGQEFK
mmetsp:Transcript_3057/g.4286  ORF Transcript_3057/g.4286 Transcript_3057/m.4286 type:complete len:270 (-) Transcript_3057:374-1183(-)